MRTRAHLALAQPSTSARRCRLRSGLFPAVIGSGARPGQSCFRPAMPATRQRRSALRTSTGAQPLVYAATGRLGRHRKRWLGRASLATERSPTFLPLIPHYDLSRTPFSHHTEILSFLPQPHEGEPLISIRAFGGVRLVALPCAHRSPRSGESLRIDHFN